MLGNVGSENTAEGATDRDKAIKPLTLLDREQVLMKAQKMAVLRD